MSEHLVHNMSQPPRTAIVIASHRRGVTEEWGLIAVNKRWLPPGDGYFVDGLCTLLGVEHGDESPEEALARWTGELLDRRGAPHAALCHSTQAARIVCERALAVAVLSRCSNQLFLRSRFPRFDPTTLSRRIRVSDPSLRRALARRTR